MKKVSLILPVYNEQESLPFFYKALCPVLQQLNDRYLFEMIFVDDGSKDDSWAIINALSAQDMRVCGIRLSRNFGHQIALATGHDKATGDAIISMDTDLQHPPSLIPQMLRAWEEGARVVYARRLDREDRWTKKIASLAFYRLVNWTAEVEIPTNVADFRLIDRTVLNLIQPAKEQARLLRGLIAWLGLPCVFIEFKCPERMYGSPSYTWKKMLKLAIDGIMGFSYLPIKIPAYLSIFFMVLSSGLCLYTWITASGLWLMTIGSLLLSIHFFVMWLLGEYIARIYDQLRGRPLYVIAQETKMHHEKSRDAFDNFIQKNNP